MAERRDEAPAPSFAFQVLGVALLGVAGALFLPWERAGRGGAVSLLDMSPAVPVLVVPVVAVAAFLAFSQHLAAIGVGLGVGLLALPCGLSAVVGPAATSVDTAGHLELSLGPWVLLLAGVGTLVSSVAAFVVARKTF